MVVSKDVQGAMHNQSQHLLTNWDALPLRIVAGDLRTNVDVPNHRTTFAGPSKAERNHVGWATVPQVTPIHFGHCSPADERDR